MSLAYDSRAAYTIAEFCVAHRFSRSKFYQLLDAGLAPRTMKIGSKVLITAEAAADWRAEREAASNQPVTKREKREPVGAVAVPA